MLDDLSCFGLSATLYILYCTVLYCSTALYYSDEIWKWFNPWLKDLESTSNRIRDEHLSPWIAVMTFGGVSDWLVAIGLQFKRLGI